MEKEFLFIGGPLHAQWLPVGLVPRQVDPSTSVDQQIHDVTQADPPHEVKTSAPESLAVGVGDEGDAPGSITRLDYALTYRRKRVVNVPQSAPGETYAVEVYLVEGVSDPNHASSLLADAVNHRWFVEHGIPVERPVNGAPVGHGRTPSGLIVPGRE